jgi:hypothetical protein
MSRKSTIAITLGALAAGAVIATGVTGVATAATGAHDNGGQASQGTTATDGAARDGMRDGSGRGDGMRGPGGMHGPRGLLEAGSEPLHGETVVKQADGTIVTLRMVSGTVTAVSATSITVTAEDGYAGTFAVSADTEVRAGLPVRGEKPADPSTATPPASTDTIADVAVGDTAHVVGTVSGSTATADRVHALSPEEAAQLEADRAAHDAAKGSASPSASSSASGA